MEYGKIKVGDVVKFNAEAKKRIASVIDEREHIIEKVKNYKDGTQHVDFKDGSGADVYWLTRVVNKKMRYTEEEIKEGIDTANGRIDRSVFFEAGFRAGIDFCDEYQSNLLQWCFNYISNQRDSVQRTAILKELVNNGCG